MTGIHYDDLTQIHTALGLLDEDTKMRLRMASHFEFLGMDGEWHSTLCPEWRPNTVYRQAPPVERPIDVDWHALGPGVYCVVRNEDGSVFAYNYDPKHGSAVWYLATKVRHPVNVWPLDGLALLRDPGEGDWRKSKVINPLWGGEKK